MNNITITSIITSQVLISIFAILITKVVNRSIYFTKGEIIAIITAIALAFIRIIIPVELSFTKNISCQNFLPDILLILNMHIPIIKINVITICLIIWILGFVIRILYLMIEHFKFKSKIESIPNTKDSITIEIINKIKSIKGVNKDIPIKKDSAFSYVAIVGVIKPVIIVPDIIFSYNEEYLVLEHEINHYIYKDIYIKVALELINSLFWWNPFIYILKKKVDNMLEMRNDVSITSKLDKEGKLDYLQSFFKISQNMKRKENNTNFSSMFSTNSPKLVHQRLNTIVNECKIFNKKILYYIIIISLIIGSYSIIFEPYIISDIAKEDYSYFLDSKNTYAIKNGSQYDIYVNNKYLTTISNLSELEFECPIKNQ